MPPATAYEIEPEFTGAWFGEVGGLPGTFEIGELSTGRYFGSFVAEDGDTEYVLLLEQSNVANDLGIDVPSNRALFAWQDGLGGRGKGWLLINRQASALTGAFGYGAATDGLGDWTLVRAE